MVGWLVIGMKAGCLTRDLGGGLSKGSQPVFIRVSEKTTENSEWLGRQGRPGFEPDASRLPVFSVTTVPLMGGR